MDLDLNRETEMLREVSEPDLPAAFCVRMERLLGDAYGDFLESFRRPRTMGLRLNPLRLGDREAEKAALETLSALFHLRKVLWAREGYYYDAGTRPGRHPYHEAGLYYIQEPSAMAVVEFLDPRPGERILDLCAAPGGKTTQIAGRMAGQGLLVSNEIHPARARILSQNVERFGSAGVVVTNESPGRLEERFAGFFDRVLADAPCSGEGMFRKDETARNEWSEEHVRLCSARQAEILDCAAVMLRPGGRLVYSTCTFAPEENEGSIQGFLDRHPDFSVEETDGCEGVSAGRPDWVPGGNGRPELAYTRRIWPHQAEGEGHYIAVLRKQGGDEEGFRQEAPAQTGAFPGKFRRKGQKDAPGTRSGGSAAEGLWRGFCGENFRGEILGGGRFALFGGQLYHVPAGMPDYAGLRVLRPGLHLGTVKNGRFEPSHALALYLRKEQVRRRCELTEEEAGRYLRGETIAAGAGRQGPDGWTLMLLDGWPLGWAKRVGDSLKNHYPKGLRKFS